LAEKDDIERLGKSTCQQEQLIAKPGEAPKVCSYNKGNGTKLKTPANKGWPGQPRLECNDDRRA